MPRLETLRLMTLVDTDVLVECLRGSTAAKTWLRALPKDAFGIPGVVAMELLMGCRNQADLQQIRIKSSSVRLTCAGRTHLNLHLDTAFFSIFLCHPGLASQIA
jgi:predicted nucleic acid-binding protein